MVQPVKTLIALGIIAAAGWAAQPQTQASAPGLKEDRALLDVAGAKPWPAAEKPALARALRALLRS